MDRRIDAETLESYRAFLSMLARLHTPDRIRVAVDPSGVVQESMVYAVRNLDQLRGETPGEIMAWLRMIFDCRLKDRVAHVTAQRRDDRLKESIHQAIDESSVRFGQILANSDSTPSQKAVRNESLLQLAVALEKLDERRRTAVELHHLLGHTVAETAEAMGITRPAVAGLIYQGLRDLRELLTN